ASKVIENAQRDINIAFMNEITMVLNKMGLSSYDVIEAARTKWNFLPFTPGLVGGHCIGVDPYYLAKSAQDIGHEPEVILAGRKINDSMGAYVAGRVDGLLEQAGQGSRKRVLVLGFTFKENINDVRNTKVVDIVRQLQDYGHSVDIHDPHALPEEVEHEYGLSILTSFPKEGGYDGIVLAVNHKSYTDMTAHALLQLLRPYDTRDKAVIYDVKGVWKAIGFPDTVSYETL
ncbi:MAG: nucleotide sugar dehydrogenase, partial [Bdellovibrionales bacterium]